MCRRITCHECRGETWTGCGLHADAVLAEVAPESRCTCPDDRSDEPIDPGHALHH